MGGLTPEQIGALATAAAAVLAIVVGVLHKFGRDVPVLSKIADVLAWLAQWYAAKDQRLARRATKAYFRSIRGK